MVCQSWSIPAGEDVTSPARESGLPRIRRRALPPGQMRVNDNTLSGNVVKIGSP